MRSCMSRIFVYFCIRHFRKFCLFLFTSCDGFVRSRITEVEAYVS